MATLKTTRTFVKADGEESSRAGPDIVAIKVAIEGGGDPIIIDLNALAKEQPGMIRAAAGFGLLTTVCNAFGGENDPYEAREKALARLETIADDGKWAAERQTGPRVTLLVEAVAMVQSERTGEAVTEEWKKAFAGKLKAEEIDQKQLQANPKIRAALEQIKAERAAEAAKKAAAAAQDATDDDLSILD